MINSTEYISKLVNMTNNNNNIDSIDIIQYTSYQLFLPSVLVYWLSQFFLTMIIGMILVRKDKENFWAIFILTQLASLIILFFIFVYPVIPNLLSNFNINLNF